MYEVFNEFIMWFLRRKNKNEKSLEQLSEEALKQINNKKYDSEIRNDGVEKILKLGIAFSGKKVRIKTNW